MLYLKVGMRANQRSHLTPLPSAGEAQAVRGTLHFPFGFFGPFLCRRSGRDRQVLQLSCRQVLQPGRGRDVFPCSAG